MGILREKKRDEGSLEFFGRSVSSFWVFALFAEWNIYTGYTCSHHHHHHHTA
jgi:hypothetical protein